MVARETSLREGLSTLGLDPVHSRLLDRLCDLLEQDAIPKGFLGPHEAGRLVERHILESAALAPLLPDGSLIDVGSGAGLPGFVLALLRRGLTVLLEAEGRRADFLERAVAELDLQSKAQVLKGRAEDAGRAPDMREVFDAAVARALAQPPVALELTLPFVRVGGMCILQVASDLEPGPSAGAARELGGGAPQLVDLRVPGLDAPRRAMIVEKIGVVPERYPRRAGVPAKRPLG